MLFMRGLDAFLGLLDLLGLLIGLLVLLSLEAFRGLLNLNGLWLTRFAWLTWHTCFAHWLACFTWLA